MLYLNSGKLFTVIADRSWNRIVYSLEDKNWIRSYGDRSGDTAIIKPVSIAVTKNGDIYVLACTSKILHLKFNEKTESISYEKTIDIMEFSLPTSISYDNNGTEDVADDYIWVADKEYGTITKIFINNQSQIVFRGVKSSQNGAMMDFYEPTTVTSACGRASNFELGIVDVNRSRIIVIEHITGREGTYLEGELKHIHLHKKIM